MALQGHFSTKTRIALEEIQDIADVVDATNTKENLEHIASIASRALTATPAEDLWSLQYISLHRIQPLIEALDDDGSTYITVTEVNSFTTSRPNGWRYGYMAII